MCDPVSLSLVSAGIGVATSVATFTGQQKAYHDNQTAANLTYANTSNSIARKATQIDAQQSESVFDNAVKSAADDSSVVASASDSGLSPNALVHSLNTVDFGNARAATLADINAQNQRIQLGQDQTDANIRRVSQINSVQKGSPVSLLLGIAGSAASAGSQYHQLGGQF